MQNNDCNDDPHLGNKMEAPMNIMEGVTEKMQEMFNKDLEEIKKSQNIMNYAFKFNLYLFSIDYVPSTVKPTHTSYTNFVISFETI